MHMTACLLPTMMCPLQLTRDSPHCACPLATGYSGGQDPPTSGEVKLIDIVKDFGAKPDDGESDSAALDNAIASVPADGVPGQVRGWTLCGHTSVSRQQQQQAGPLSNGTCWLAFAMCHLQLRFFHPTIYSVSTTLYWCKTPERIPRFTAPSAHTYPPLPRWWCASTQVSPTSTFPFLPRPVQFTVIYFPPGEYTLTARVKISKPIVLRGAGKSKTKIHWAVSMDDLYPDEKEKPGQQVEARG